MLFITAAALLLHLSACSAGDPCPPKALLAPCTCTHIPVQNGALSSSSSLTTATPFTTVQPRRKRDTFTETKETPLDVTESGSLYTVVDCKISKNLAELEETVYTALNRKLVDKLTVANVPPRKEHALARLPSGWLKRVRLRQFEVLNSKLSGDFIWYGNPFEGQDQSLRWFAAKKCYLSGSLTFDTRGTVNTKGLNLLPHIEGVDFSENYLTSIMNPSFRNPPKNLTTVILSRNSINFIEGGTFHHTQLLKYVDLSHNVLESVMRSIFESPARNLEYIDLSWNLLTTLPHDFFINMPSLKYINVSNNFLYSMPEKPWNSAWRYLKDVDLTGNFLECNCDLLWLLPIVAPLEDGVTNASLLTTADPSLEQTVKGYCIKTSDPRLFAMKYDLVTLTRDRLAC